MSKLMTLGFIVMAASIGFMAGRNQSSCTPEAPDLTAGPPSKQRIKLQPGPGLQPFIKNGADMKPSPSDHSNLQIGPVGGRPRPTLRPIPKTDDPGVQNVPRDHD